VIPLSAEPAIPWFPAGYDGKGDVSAAELCRELPDVRHDHFVRSQRIKAYPMLIRMNEASMLESTRSFRQIPEAKDMKDENQAVALPHVDRLSYDLASVCRKRYSPGMDFVLRKVSQRQLALLLKEATASFPYRNDLDGAQEKPTPRVSLYGCLYGVEGIPDGAYRYDSAAHALERIRPGDHRLRLQQGMSLHNVNLFQVPLCLHVAGNRDHLKSALGYRGYRIQQMEAGMLVQRILLAAAAIGMGGHPLLGFDAGLCDALYQMAPEGKTSLIQIPVGPCRLGSRWVGGLHG
jgi:SagB-type dehydrogenase family enzyme